MFLSGWVGRHKPTSCERRRPMSLTLAICPLKQIEISKSFKIAASSARQSISRGVTVVWSLPSALS